jgi:pyruvate ferredoxin oxidoreductase gamma subunit
MLAAIVKISKVMTDKEFLNNMKDSFNHKFAKKPEVIEGNMKALELALKHIEEVKI